jgi:drug/metabolite transporter (DMT)-like permease
MSKYNRTYGGLSRIKMGEGAWPNSLDFKGQGFIKLHLTGDKMQKEHVDLSGFSAIAVLTFLWGLNYTAIKFSNAGLSPVFTSLVRSCVASACGIVYCLAVRQPLFHRGMTLFHGAMIGILFGLEFVCLYLGVLYTDSARAVIFLYLSPFVVAIGAHFFLKERLTPLKIVGLIVAFSGIYLVFRGKPSKHSELMLLGDVLEVVAAFFWGATTLYIKKYVAQRMQPINTFLYQFIFSIPIMLVAACLLEDRWITAVTPLVVGSMIYQSIIIAFASYLVWFKLIHVYPVASLSAFTFLTPVFGVLFGALILKEELTLGLISGLICVCLGIYCVNYRKTS